MIDAEQRARDAGLDVVDWDLELADEFRHRLPSQSLTLAARRYAGGRGAFYSNAARGFFVVTDYAMLSEALDDPAVFSSAEGEHLFLREPMLHRPLPIQMDPPEHTKIRKLLAPYFTPRQVAGKFEQEARTLCHDAVATIAPRGACDAIADFGEPVTAAITSHYMGVDPTLVTALIGAVRRRSRPSTVGSDKDQYREGVNTIADIFADILAQRRARPLDDIPSALLQARIDGHPLTDDVVLNLCCTTFAAGVHTTSAELGFIYYYLASDPALRHRIVNDPALIPRAVEELLRFEASAVINGRVLARDVTFHGIALRTGDRVLLVLEAANRDPAVFSEPDRIEFDRYPNPHLAFGKGIHRCVGSLLARMIMQVALEEWHRRIPEYALGDLSGVTYDLSANARMSAVPLVFPPSNETATATR
ncbi:MAG: cytochrome P450 [Gammaproteobacteria bacterium]